MNYPTVCQISECFIKPQYASQDSKLPYYLTPWDLAMLSAQYIQKGLLFAKPPEAKHDEDFMADLLEGLKESLSLALVHFYPLAGRLATVKSENPASYWVFVDCDNSPGAKLIYAALDMTINDILSPVDVPLVVQSFFDHHKAVNHDGHTLSLLSIQVTELLDGVFIGCSMNHAIGDGTSYWNFFNMWSEIFQKKRGDSVNAISRPPVLERWFPPGHGPIINLPFTHHDQFICRFESPKLRERMFHFTSESMAKLKAKANAECNTTKISSFQALSAFVWRAITRVRGLPADQTTSCRLATNCRPRLNPPLSQEYFGNSIGLTKGVATAGELLEHDLGWAAWQLHEAVVSFTHKTVESWLDSWLESPEIYQLEKTFDPFSVMMGSSPRFNKYGNEFGMGKALALRSGYANKFSGKVTSYPGPEGGGSIDLEVCLPPDTMSALESDKDFMEAASTTTYLSSQLDTILLNE
ncbi:hypothetical protein FEM48_Zijuj06G0034500 [Ziziphus jujuba var. spinosa]|uniref:Uncharacterized protein n=1 Tax=Ziziphus jujuba var. spinosa TaxID=714518 RepID=A0A978V6W6_ZIZJJ|nr:hypothetical protein FEM48_Zijuj06G0034500 [Ziziphus jujuba var. spinosa]